MTIRPGQPWGEVVGIPAELVDVGSDAELAAHVAAGDARPVRVTGGDLRASLGGGDAAAGDAKELRRFPIDVLRVDADGQRLTAVAHVVARSAGWRGWRGPIIAVLNVDRVGRWDVAPRAHPNDGRADVVEVDASMGWRARWQARQRLPTGTHVPHPAIRTERVVSRAWELEGPLELWVDAVHTGPVLSLRVAVEPDAATVHI